MRTKTMVGMMAALIAVFSLSACAGEAEQSETAVAPVDYEAADHWLAHPEDVTKPIDTIYLYPTGFMDASEEAPAVCEIDEESMRQAAQGYYLAQASVYEDSTNVFAPYYRQVNLAAVYGMPTKERDALSAGVPQTDVFAALDHYFEEDNGGRPFILAGHSQGSQMLTNVLSKYMGAHPEYLERMVAAYVIGYSVTDEYLAANPHLKFAEGESDTGVIVSWNTEGPDNKEQESFVILPGAQCINPLNWKRDGTYAGAELNLGGYVPDQENGGFMDVPQAADAVIDMERGVIVTTTTAIQPVAAQGFGTDSFHNGDYSLYYYNLQENVEKRCAAFLQKTEGSVNVWTPNDENTLSKVIAAKPDGIITDEPALALELIGTHTDYDDVTNWITRPEEQTHDVDTFFIYQTVYQDSSPEATDIAAIDNRVMRAVAQAAYLANAMVFEEDTDVYAPYYRQSNITALIDHKDDMEAWQMNEQRTDIFDALDHYFEHCNNGRPFILAGHSQGSMMVKIIVEDYMQAHPEYYERMIAAYIVGYSVTEEDLKKYPHLKFTERPDDTGVLISWNTEGPENKDAENLVVLPGAIAVNPISWTRDDAYIPAEKNEGSRIADPNAVLREVTKLLAAGAPVTLEGLQENASDFFTESHPGIADAQIDPVRGVVICTNREMAHTTSDDPAVGDIFGPASFHTLDYGAYYYSIRQNLKARIAAYFEKHESGRVAE